MTEPKRGRFLRQTLEAGRIPTDLGGGISSDYSSVTFPHLCSVRNGWLRPSDNARKCRFHISLKNDRIFVRKETMTELRIKGNRDASFR